MSRPYGGWLARNVEYETIKGDKKSVNQSTLPLRKEAYAATRKRMEAGNVFLYHLAEGRVPSLIKEYTELKAEGCVRAELIGIHSTALRRAQFDDWASSGAGAIVWSPLSNLWLYRETADVVAARAAGLTVCLGSDWAPSGSKNILGELKVADLWNRERLNGTFSDQALCEMVTVNPASALKWGRLLGRVKRGLHADLLVTAKRAADPYRNLIESTERDVQLVMVGGRPVYGTSRLMRAAGAWKPEPIVVDGQSRAISLLIDGVADADMTWKETIRTLEQARRDPAGMAERGAEREPGVTPLRLFPDLPGGQPPAERRDIDLTKVKIGPLDSLAHDAKFFNSLKRAPILDGQLNGLRVYYRRA